MRIWITLVAIALLLPGPAVAGRRVAATVPTCGSSLATLQADVEGDEDRCVATAAPGCATGERLAVDAQGQADRCLPQGSDPAPPESAREPRCVVGLSLEQRPAADVCRGVEKPRCPESLKLRAMKGEDLCRK
jgi:hypothetical protein